MGLLLRKPRSATILAVQDTHMLAISKIYYEQIIRVQEDQKMEKLIKFYN